ncbi:MAG: carboxymuconolactone decarboxylase family protein [Elusimicrobia bacterium]|jgi:AhpD family alkylhydroperoxidase|nr:MAG: carboxymuconolactone decarboxylase family protein [Elusimicrobiota bacterium]
MHQRLNPAAISPAGYQAQLGLQSYVNESGIEKPLLELVKLRASQINGCAYCIAMHATEAARDGESQARLYLLPAWRETALYTPRERAALAWAEALTLVADSRVPDEVYQEARRQFSEKELVDLAFAVIAINGWNRLAVAFRLQPESGG